MVYSDIDCVFLINKGQSVKKVWKHFTHILSRRNRFKIRDICLTASTVMMIKLQIEEFIFDLVFVESLISNKNISAGNDSMNLVSLQQKHILDSIKTSPASLDTFISAENLVQATVRFVKSQDEFTRNMIRLAKCWLKVHSDITHCNAKVMIELIAIYAAQIEMKQSDKSYSSCYCRFLSLIKDFDNLNIVFEEEYIFPEHQVIDTSRPRVIDPVNPYYNLAKGWKSEEIMIIKAHASWLHAAVLSSIITGDMTKYFILEVMFSSLDFLPFWF